MAQTPTLGHRRVSSHETMSQPRWPESESKHRRHRSDGCIDAGGFTPSGSGSAFSNVSSVMSEMTAQVRGVMGLKKSSYSLLEDAASDGGRSPYEQIRRTKFGGLALRLIRCALVFTLFEDGLRLAWQREAQTTLVLSLMLKRTRRKVVPLPKYALSYPFWSSVVAKGLAVTGLGQMCGSVGVVFAKDDEAAHILFRLCGTGLSRVDEPVNILLLLLLFRTSAGFFKFEGSVLVLVLSSFSLPSSLWLIHSKSPMLSPAISSNAISSR